MSTRNWGTPWSTNPYAPQIPYWLYFAEKANFAGFLIGAIFYGITIVMFFQCLGAIFSSTNRARAGTNWYLFSYCMATFSFVTIYTAMNLNLQSISYIDNREFPGNDQAPPGPLGYQWLIHNSGLSIVPNFMFMLNNWLADGLLIWYCLSIYAMNYSVIAFPCIVFVGSFATGIWFLVQTGRSDGIWNLLPSKIGLPYFAISSGLTVLLVVMLLARFFQYAKNVRTAMGAQTTWGSYYRAFVAMLLDSCILYAINSLLFVIPWGIGSYVSSIFLPILSQTQVIATYFMVVRIANHAQITDEILMTGKAPIVLTKKNEKSIPGGPGGTVFLPGGGITSIDRHTRSGVGFVATIDLHQEAKEKV